DHQPADRRAVGKDDVEVRAGDFRGEACPPGQCVLQPAGRGAPRIRGATGGDHAPGEAAVHRAARDQQRAADRRAHRRDALSETPDRHAERPRVVLGVAGGIAAYKACELLRLFTESGHTVRVVPTEAALRFVGEPTWAALSGQPVATDVWAQVQDVPHVAIGKAAELVVIAPATADLLARAAHGLADDLLTNTLLTARCPVVYAPAMHTEMWEHPATVANVAMLRERGSHVLEPAEGRLTGADSGKGRLPEPDEIFAACRVALDAHAGGSTDLAGRHVVVTAGGTREPIDPV